MRKAIFAGSFDPVHKGHIQIITKASQLFDELHVVVANNHLKTNQNNIEDRLKIMRKNKFPSNVFITYVNEKYIGTFAKEMNIKYLVRSARNNIDFNYELDMAKLNREINNNLETVLIIPDYEDIIYSSSTFKDFVIKDNK
ncbi:pantetheine-phosphate adenylyltransferase [Candidatus Mycoplasma mahonii]|uniref:pantetheine-phosphate adenylyltransferase n=1 Tax=Candidatus Mycoplasma mahonii TaxID=3004105 RepID=UPI0026EFE069|nr:pantetheine-phosphate adenylyltransferase [Candidatus Mycoplasma mahonii]WKX02569.1 pantetheine-phosphate adenylyltransferase [Candidatus Mycoplasma mahonii]